jgi:5-formyltetrahydrofolate cyclo-ligase
MTHPGLQASKKIQRKEFRSQLLALPRPSVNRSGAAVAELLGSVVRDKRVASFCPIGGEPDFAQHLSGAASVAYPRCLPDTRELRFAWMPGPPSVIGEHGIPEPDDLLPSARPWEFDVVLVPGAAFSLRGDRLGWGAGYYDRFLATLRPNTLLCGVANDFQVVDDLPTEPHDVAVEMIITPTRVIHCRSEPTPAVVSPSLELP